MVARMRIVVLDAFTTDQGQHAAWDLLNTIGEVTVHARTAAKDVVARLADAEIAITNKVCIDDAVFAACPQLRYVGVMATGYNIIDIAAARRRGVAVCNVPGYSTAGVAQHVFALVLHLLVDVAGHDAAVKAGAWARSPDFCFFRQPLRELDGKTLVIIGMGAIGAAVARIAEAFGMRVIAAAVPGSTTPDRVALDQALPHADVVSLHCPLTDATRAMVDARFLARMKAGAILINTGRGALINEAALRDALANAHLAGAGLDVLSDEPPSPTHLLIEPQAPWASRLVITPHIAWGTVEARSRLIGEVTANLRAFLAGERRNRVD